MKINNKNLTSFNAFLISFSRGVRVRKQEYTSGMSINLVTKGFLSGFSVSLKVGIKEQSKSLLEQKISKLAKELEESELEEVGIPIIYKCSLKEVSVEEFLHDELENKEYAVVTFDLDCIDKYSPEKVVSFKSSTSIVLESTERTPARVEITPSIGIPEVVIKGFEDEITLKNLKTGKTIIIDNGLVIEDGVNKYNDYDSWGFPTLLPGTNNLSVNKSNLDIKVKYNPRWI